MATWGQGIDVAVRLGVRGFERIDALTRQVLALSREPGPQGERGPPGNLPITKAWVDRVYDEGETVTRDGNLYQALVRTGKEPKHPDWQLLVPKGADGRGWTSRGVYEASQTYVEGDVVWRDLSPFLARTDNPGPCEEGNANWQLIVPKPSRGPQGRQGEPGRAGAPGGPVKPIKLRALSGYMAQQVLDDGSFGEPFSVRIWFDEYHAETR